MKTATKFLSQDSLCEHLCARNDCAHKQYYSTTSQIFFYVQVKVLANYRAHVNYFKFINSFASAESIPAAVLTTPLILNSALLSQPPPFNSTLLRHRTILLWSATVQFNSAPPSFNYPLIRPRSINPKWKIGVYVLFYIHESIIFLAILKLTYLKYPSIFQ